MERIIGFDLQLLSEMFWTALNVLILFGALSYLLFNPVRDMLEQRRAKIIGDLSDAAKDKEDAAALKAEYEKRLRMVSAEADMIMENARAKAKITESEILAQTRAEAARIVERGRREVELERKKALDEMRKEIVSIAALMAGKAIAVSMDMKIQNQLIEETLKEMGESTWQS